MSSEPVPPSNPPHFVRPLSPATKAVAGILLAIPLAALALVPIYAKAGPHVWGIPFFYWYQFMWVFLASGFTYSAYVVIERARRGGDR